MFNLEPMRESRMFYSYALGMAYIERDGETTSRSPFKSLDSSKKEDPVAKRDFTGAGTLGDIMSDEKQENDMGLSFAGLVTADGGTLAEKYGIKSRLDRMALTANGNLQRLFSSYYDAPVHVVIDKCNQNSQKTWNRLVHLTVFDQVFCSANSTVIIHDQNCQTLVKSGQVGLGQLFRHLDRLPIFELLDAGYSKDGALWRVYELKCEEVSCTIRENFHPSAWELSPKH